jgi:hypothetical protein
MAGVAACDSPKTGTAENSVMEDWDFGDDPLAIRLKVEGSGRVFACGAGFSAGQVERDLVDAITGAPSHCQGSNGNYVCDCESVAKESYAFSCPAALFELCNVEAQRVDGTGDEPPAVTECSALSREIEGSCVLDGDDRFECACEDDEGTSTMLSGDGAQTPASCDQALFQACAIDCADDFGACTPSTDGLLGQYDCSCATNGFEHVAFAGSCEAALLSACNPLNQAQDVCTGYGGSCALSKAGSPNELTCTCVGATEREVVSEVDTNYRACRATLEGTCGLGAAPEGALCVAEGNGYTARCTRGPEAGAQMTCECHQDGAASARIEQVDEQSCDQALLETFCPELTD